MAMEIGHELNCPFSGGVVAICSDVDSVSKTRC